MTSQATLSQPTLIAGVRFHKIGKLYHFDSSAYPELQPGDHVIVETTRGRQMGQVMGFADQEQDREYKPILRRATPRDLLLSQSWQEREVAALVRCREAAADSGSTKNVKFVAAQYNYDGSLLTFLYHSEGDKKSPNMNKLRNVLKNDFRDSRVELRQVGPRDVAKLLGGYGACGQPRCCSTFLTDFSPISIKMAKEQGVSLNPSEITGMCGRLRCCLVYEYEQYVAARKQLPKRNKRIGTPLGEAKVIDVLPLQDAVMVVINDERHTFSREELIPLEEWQALQKKAQEGCSKNENGGCDCGANGNR
ncbi:MAG: stage 0 sporulation protein [Anaerolineae bacterium]|nr:stage 0 sporulation protein [Anaerolineae bacterium]